MKDMSRFPNMHLMSEPEGRLKAAESGLSQSLSAEMGLSQNWYEAEVQGGGKKGRENK